MILSCKSRSKF